MSTSSISSSTEAYIVKEGCLAIRGEYIHNFKDRYFVLRSDGSFLGFKEKPKSDEQYISPLNNFSVQRAQVMKSMAGRKNAFVIRRFLLTTLFERTYATDSSGDREDWMQHIETVSKRLEEEARKLLKVKGGDVESSKEVVTKTLEDFKMLKVLGKGSFGKGSFRKVTLGKEIKTGSLYVMKIFRKDVLFAKDEVEHTLTENRVFQNAKHPFLLELMYSFQTTDRVVFVMEYANGGELFFHLSRDKIFSEKRSMFYGAEIALALQYLHKNKIVYHDLKLENLLLDATGHIKITDFGLCKQEISFTDKTKTSCGTPEYLAPEVLEDNDYGQAIDWWTFGVVLYEMLCGRLPFYNRDHEVLFDLILTKSVKFPSRLSVVAKSILEGLLEKSPDKRLGGSRRDAEDVMDHKFFESVDWEAMKQKKVKPPFVPKIGNKEDKFFDSVDREEPKLTPPDGNELDGDESVDWEAMKLFPPATTTTTTTITTK